MRSPFIFVEIKFIPAQRELPGKGAYLKRTISAMVGKGSVNHNDRKFHAKNTDPSRTVYNITYQNEDIREVYHQLFDEALERYNAKQKRSDRMIDDYYEKIRSGKQEKTFHELIIQIGNKDDMAADSQDGEQAKQILDQYMRGFQERNPNLRVFSAHLHMDEATPHLHIDFIPFTTGSKRGLETRVSLKQALAAQGFKGGTRGDTEWNQWVNAEKECLAELMLEHGIEWEKLGTHEEHLSVLDYKKKVRSQEVAELTAEVAQRQEQVNELDERKEQRSAEVEALDAVAVERAGEVAALDQRKAEKEDELSTLDAEIVEKRAESQKVERTLERVKKKKVRVSEIEAVKPKQIPLSNQVVLSKQDFDTLVSGAEQLVVQKKQESRLQKLLDKANAVIEGLKQTIAGLREEIDRLKKELSEYKSVKGRLDRGKLERENRELKEENGRLKGVLREHGINLRRNTIQEQVL